MLDCGCHIWTQKCRGSEKYLRLFFGREKHAVVGYSILCGSHRNQYSYLYQYTCCLLCWFLGFFEIKVRFIPGGLVVAVLFLAGYLQGELPAGYEFLEAEFGCRMRKTGNTTFN